MREDPYNDFQAFSGPHQRAATNRADTVIRVDSHAYAGYTIYHTARITTSLIAKIIAVARTPGGGDQYDASGAERVRDRGAFKNDDPFPFTADEG